MNIEARREAIESLSTLVRRDDLWMSEHHAVKIAERLVAHALVVRGYLASVEEGERTVLKQQRTAQLEDVEWWAEHLHHLQRELADATAIYERVKARHLAEYDPDAVAQDREDDRLREQRHDEHANRQAVRP